MIFEQIATGGCQSYLIGCDDTCAGALIDPGARARSIATSASRRATACASATSSTPTPTPTTSRPRASSREQLGAPVGDAPRQPGAVRRPARRRRRDARRRQAAPAACCTRRATPPTRCAWCSTTACFTGDTLLIGGTGRTDLPTGDPDALYDSLFGKLLKLDPALLGLPGARLQGPQPLDDRRRDRRATRACRRRERAEFVADDAQPRPDDADPPHRGAAHQHAAAARPSRSCSPRRPRDVPFMSHGRAARARRARRPTSWSSSTCARRTPSRPATSRARAPAARPARAARRQRAARSDARASSPTASSARSRRWRRRRCATMGFTRAVALDGGMKAWREAGYPTRPGAQP